MFLGCFAYTIVQGKLVMQRILWHYNSLVSLLGLIECDRLGLRP